MKKENNKKNAGFTIIETMISVSIFVIIIMAGMGALLNANALHQKSQNMRSVLDNLSFIMEDISKNLRTGYSYYCITGIDNLSNVAVTKSGQNCWGIAFEFASGDSTEADGDPIDNNDQWVYFIGTNGTDPKVRVYRSILGPYTSSSFTALTTDEITINSTASGFSVLGAGNPLSGDQQQPFVIIKLVGSINSKGIDTSFSLQTAVSQRAIDR